jgi:hypothetical protein
LLVLTQNSKLGLLQPADCPDRATVNALLDFFDSCTGGIIGNRFAVFETEDFRRQRNAQTATDTILPVDPDITCHICVLLRLIQDSFVDF